MATSAYSLPSQKLVSQHMYKLWIPVLCGLTVLCLESTPVMGGSNTLHWLASIWPPILGKTDTASFGELHHLLRKTGHFTGYGTLSVFLCRAWYNSIRLWLKVIGTQLIFSASALAVSITFLCGSLDELHQSVTPGRSSTATDVMIDTCGGLLFNLAFWALRSRKGREMLDRLHGTSVV